MQITSHCFFSSCPQNLVKFFLSPLLKSRGLIGNKWKNQDLKPSGSNSRFFVLQHHIGREIEIIQGAALNGQYPWKWPECLYFKIENKSHYRESVNSAFYLKPSIYCQILFSTCICSGLQLFWSFRISFFEELHGGHCQDSRSLCSCLWCMEAAASQA